MQNRLFAKKCLKILFFSTYLLLFQWNQAKILGKFMSQNLLNVNWERNDTLQKLSIIHLIGSDKISIAYPFCSVFRVIWINRSLLFTQNVTYIVRNIERLKVYWTHSHTKYWLFCAIIIIGSFHRKGQFPILMGGDINIFQFL